MTEVYIAVAFGFEYKEIIGVYDSEYGAQTCLIEYITYYRDLGHARYDESYGVEHYDLHERGETIIEETNETPPQDDTRLTGRECLGKDLKND